MKTKLLILLCLALAPISWSQTGGMNAFPFLDLSYNARSGGLGGDFLTGWGDDLNMGIENPSLLNSEMHNDLSINEALHPGGIHHGMLNYGFNLKDCGTVSTFVQFMDYGRIERTAVNGTSEGHFHPIDMAIGVGMGRQLNPRLGIGANAKILYSQLETYSSFGIAADLAGTFHNEEKGFLVTAKVKNIGVQFNAYNNGNRAPLRTDFQLAGAYKLPHAPFRFTLLAHNLNRWDLTYNDPNLEPTIDALTGDTIPAQSAGFGEKFARHLSYQLELLISKKIHIRTGFDYHRRKELAVTQRPGAAGFSFGLGLYFRRFNLDYGFLIYSNAGFNNLLTLSTNIDKWRR